MTDNSGIIVDASPALTFLARNDTTKVLFQGLRGLNGGSGFASPETVAWRMLENARRIEVLPDDETADLSIAVQRLTNTPMAVRITRSEDLGEIMVIAHASVLANAGRQVTILIQEREGTALARKESARSTRMEPLRGSIRVLSTEDVLVRAIGSPEIPDRGAMKALYSAMRPLDAALLPIERTELLTSARWDRSGQPGALRPERG